MSFRLGVCVLVVLALGSMGACESAGFLGGATNWFSGELGLLQKMFDDCSINSRDPTYCLKNKAATAVERALSRNISFVDGLSLVRNTNSGDTRDNFIADPDQRIAGALRKLMDTHTFALDLSDQVDEEFEDEKEIESNRDLSEARKKKKKKKKKMLPYVLMATLTAMTVFGPMIVKTLSLVAGKALLASKLALVISGIILLKKLFSNDHHEVTTFQVHTVPEHHHSRAFDSIDNFSKFVNDNFLDPYRGHSKQ